MRRSIPILVLTLAAALGAAACEDTQPTTPDPTPPELVTETFMGTIGVNGSASHTFLASQSGAVTATLTTVEPDASIAVHLSLGTWNGSVCQVVLPNDNAVQGTRILGTASVTAFLCVRIADIGQITEPLNYTITVAHP